MSAASIDIESSDTIGHNTKLLLRSIEDKQTLLLFGYCRNLTTQDAPIEIIHFCLLYAFFNIEYFEDEIKQIKSKGKDEFNKQFCGQRRLNFANRDINLNLLNVITVWTKGIDHRIYERQIANYAPLIELRQVLYLKRSTAYQAMNKITESLQDTMNCIQASEKQNMFTYKAYYIQSKIYLELTDYENAIQCIDKVINVC